MNKYYLKNSYFLPVIIVLLVIFMFFYGFLYLAQAQESNQEQIPMMNKDQFMQFQEQRYRTMEQHRMNPGHMMGAGPMSMEDFMDMQSEMYDLMEKHGINPAYGIGGCPGMMGGMMMPGGMQSESQQPQDEIPEMQGEAREIEEGIIIETAQ